MRAEQSAPSAAIFVYDAANDIWLPRASMPTARGALGVAAIDGKIYAAGGSPSANERDFAVYDVASDQWTALPSMPTARNHLAAAAVGGHFLAVGGRSGSIGGITAALEAYDPAANTWTALRSMPTARGGIAGVAVGDCLYVFGGEGNQFHPQGIFDQVEVYEPSTGFWQGLDPMEIPRHGIGAAVIGRRIYIPGGATVQGFGATAVHQALDLGGL
jgi:N-acetylneuraminic acid mutarotase